MYLLSVTFAFLCHCRDICIHFLWQPSQLQDNIVKCKLQRLPQRCQSVAPLSKKMLYKFFPLPPPTLWKHCHNVNLLSGQTNVVRQFCLSFLYWSKISQKCFPKPLLTINILNSADVNLCIVGYTLWETHAKQAKKERALFKRRN